MAQELGITAIAEKYAQAYYELSEEKDLTGYFRYDLWAISKLIKECHELRLLLEHPIIEQKAKKSIIEEVLTNKVNPLSINLMKLLIDRNRVSIIHIMAEKFIEIYNTKNNIVPVQVITAISLNEHLKNLIGEKLAALLDKTVELESKVDETIIGGVLLKIDDKIIDGSIKGRLESIKGQII